LIASDDSRINIQKMPMIIRIIESDATAVTSENAKSKGFFLDNIDNEKLLGYTTLEST
jgi:hypothetical protein